MVFLQHGGNGISSLTTSRHSPSPHGSCEVRSILHTISTSNGQAIQSISPRVRSKRRSYSQYRIDIRPKNSPLPSSVIAFLKSVLHISRIRFVGNIAAHTRTLKARNSQTFKENTVHSRKPAKLASTANLWRSEMLSDPKGRK